MKVRQKRLTLQWTPTWAVQPHIRDTTEDSFLDRRAPLWFSDTLRSHLSNLDTPRALTVWLLYNGGEHDQLLKLTCSPKDYCDPDLFRRDWAATKLLSKAKFLKVSNDPKAVAWRSWVEAEHQCALTNQKVKYPLASDEALHSLLERVRRKIDRILGRCVEQRILRADGMWGPGATSSCKGRWTNVARKFGSLADSTSAASGESLLEIRNHVLWGQSILKADGPVSLLNHIEIQRGNKLSYVPKSAKTDRVICVEPHMNIWFQKKIGSYIRHRLRLNGCDLRFQDWNQYLASEGAISNYYSTIDLRSASDTISRELVRSILSPRWASLLDRFRSPFTLVKGKWFFLEKFSSMGNGYTFELETLIFYAVAALSCDTREIGVYGDDIVVPRRVAGEVISNLHLLGFSINEDKTFIDGMFRESCGWDSFLDMKVTPLYIRDEPKTVTDWILLHNRLRAWATRNGCIDLRTQSLLNWMRGRVPGPLGDRDSGDGHYHVNFDVARPSRLRLGYEGYCHKTLVSDAPLDHSVSEQSKYVAALSAHSSREGIRHSSRNSRRRRKRTVIAVEWHDVLVV